MQMMPTDLKPTPAFGRDAGAAPADTVARPAAGVQFGDRAQDAATFLKALSHEGRLLILCHLADGERSVTELEEMLGVRQAAVSQQLARLRIEGLVGARRSGKQIFYSIRDPRVGRTVALVQELFADPA
jgi:ArsR family transcriptional regulator